MYVVFIFLAADSNCMLTNPHHPTNSETTTTSASFGERFQSIHLTGENLLDYLCHKSQNERLLVSAAVAQLTTHGCRMTGQYVQKTHD